MKCRKIAIVATYYNRELQFRRTLKSIASSAHTNYHIIVVDDASDKPVDVSTAPVPVEVVRIEPPEKTWVGTVVACNIGIHYALSHDPDVIIIQNAECYHVGDVLMHANDHVTDENCISFSCWNLSANLSVSNGSYNLRKVIAADNPFRTDGGSTGWYNHPRWRPTAYDFCNAMSVNSMVKLNGHDERFKEGIGFADNDLVRRIGRLGLNLIITDGYHTDEPFVVHQWHEGGPRTAGFQVNKVLYSKIMQEPNYRAYHIVTEDFS